MAANPETFLDPIAFTLDGIEVEALPGESILKCAERLGTEIPEAADVFDEIDTSDLTGE